VGYRIEVLMSLAVLLQSRAGFQLYIVIHPGAVLTTMPIQDDSSYPSWSSPWLYEGGVC
jgi:hypothetical protein